MKHRKNNIGLSRFIFITLKKFRNTKIFEKFFSGKIVLAAHSDGGPLLSFEGRHAGELAEVGQLVVEEDPAFDARLRDDGDAAAAAGAAVAVDGQGDTLLHLNKKIRAQHWQVL